MKSNYNVKKNIETIIFMLIASVPIIIGFIFDGEIKIKDQQNIVNTLSQIQISIVSLTVTMMSISTSFINEKIFGVKLKAILKLRKGFTLSLLSTFIILSIYTIITIYTIVKNMLLLSIILLALTIWICLSISIQDLPICFYQDEAIIRLLKNNRINKTDFNDLNNQETYNTLILNLIIKKKFHKVYKLLKKDNDNNELIDYLFDIIISKFVKFIDYEDSQTKHEFNTYVYSILENISLLLNKNNSIFDEYDDANKIAVYISSIFYHIKLNEKSLSEKTIQQFERNFNHMFTILMFENNDKRKRIFFNAFQNILSSSLCNCQLWAVELLKKNYSTWHNTFTNHTLINILFSEISLVLFYYYEYESLIKKEFKTEIKKIIDNSKEYNSTEIDFPWKILFQEHLKNYSLKIDNLMSYTKIDMYEFLLYNRPKSCIFSDRSIINWWIKCLLYSSNFHDYNLDFLNRKFDGNDLLFACLDDLFELNSKKIILNISFQKFANFFDLKIIDFNNHPYYEKIINNLFNLKNEYMKQLQSLDTITDNSDDNLECLRDTLKNGTINFLNNLGNLDKNINLSGIEPKRLYSIIEIYDLEESGRVYLEWIKNCFIQDFQFFFKNEFSSNYISLKETLSEHFLEEFIASEPTMTTGKIMYLLNYPPNINTKLKTKLVDLDKKITQQNNLLIGEYCYFNENSVKYNYEIVTFDLNQLSDDNILKELDTYKSENGIYFYQGIQYNQKELFDLLKKKLFTIKVFIKYKIEYNKHEIYAFDPYDNYNK